MKSDFRALSPTVEKPASLFQSASCRGSRERSESDLPNHLCFVLPANMGIDFQQQGPVVLVPKPAGDGADIDTGFKARRAEKMAQRMRRETGDAEVFYRRS